MESTPYEFDSLTELPPLPQEFIPHYRNDSLPPFPPSDFTPSFSELLHLQHHHLGANSFFLESNHLFNNEISTTTQFLHSPDLNDDTTTTTPFLHLPDLKSIEQVEDPTTTKQFLSLSPPLSVSNRHKKQLHSSSSSTTSDSPSHVTVDYGANKRKKISNKIRSLEKLMPWEKKMSLAMILEESHKYIKFLQSQIASLHWMPLESVYNTAGEFGESDLLKSLTRQQILQVIANSPGSRNALSSHGVCVFSYEQLLSLKSMSRRNL